MALSVGLSIFYIIYCIFNTFCIYLLDLLSFAVLQSAATIINYTLISIILHPLYFRSIILHFSSIYSLRFYWFKTVFNIQCNTYIHNYNIFITHCTGFTITTIISQLCAFCIAPLLLYLTHLTIHLNYIQYSLHRIYHLSDIFTFQPLSIFCGTCITCLFILLYFPPIVQGFRALYRRC